MSIDPAAIPSFGGQPANQPPAGPPGGGVVRPDQNLVKQLLEQMQLKFVVDDEGDLTAPWEHFRTYFMFRGEGEQEIYAVRTFYDRTYPLDDKPRLLEATDEWNHQTLWPKVYTHTQDDGVVRLIGEAQMLLGLGVGLQHFISSTVSWVRASIDFDKWIVDRLGLDTDDESADGTDGAAETAPEASEDD